MLKNIKKKVNSDTAAAFSVETIVLICVAVFAVLAIFNYISKPTQEGAQVVGEEIKKQEQNAIDAMYGNYGDD